MTTLPDGRSLTYFISKVTMYQSDLYAKYILKLFTFTTKPV